MSLQIGSTAADSGMTQAIYDQINVLLAPPLEAAVANAEEPAKPGAQQALDAAREGWKKLAFAIATGIVTHLTSNMEVVGVTTQGTVNMTVQGSTGSAPPSNHQHTVSINASAANVVFTQNNDGVGRVR